jgi:hypothetical protein
VRWRQELKYKKRISWHYNMEDIYKNREKHYCGEKDTILTTENDG